MMYYLPVYWQMSARSARVFVEASSLDEAIAKANAAGTLPESRYVTDSFAVDEEIAREEYGDNGEKTLTLQLLGHDGWNRPVYRAEDGTLFVDTDPRKDRAPKLCTKYHNMFEGEPDMPISDGITAVFIPFRATWD